MFGDPRSKNGENGRFCALARSSRRSRARVLKDIVTPNYRLLFHKLESIYFKFGENRSKTVGVIASQRKRDPVTPVTLTFDLDLYKSIGL